ncbi:unnamed protein product [Owenia fusiformis]|uniref:DUF2428 domain-containing protein n=1 Tax=Owenia fusiformis TaxID=6347 RepID=A0A8S4PD60_OWEFU|nr:unnamed protein product [Owenia fusiformis]
MCATRRSAGLPFYIQALVTTEPASTGRQSLKMMMSQLLALAQEDENVSISSEPKTSSGFCSVVGCIKLVRVSLHESQHIEASSAIFGSNVDYGAIFLNKFFSNFPTQI